MAKGRFPYQHWLLVILITITILSPVQGDEPPQSSRPILEAYKALQESNPTTAKAPFVVRSTQKGEQIGAEVYSLLDIPYSQISEVLTKAENWCQFLPLNLNVKACTYQKQKQDTQLTLYLGRKYYQPPSDAYLISYQYKASILSKEELKVTMYAKEGPMGSSDYTQQLEAIGIEEKTLIRIQVAHTPSWLSNLASEGYLATLGRNKIGFSIEGYEKDGTPRYSRGAKAAIERNTMRYYLALKVFLENRHLPPEQQYEQLIKQWFELTEHYHRQLHEMSEEEYLQAKRRERANQQQLQKSLDQQ